MFYASLLVQPSYIRQLSPFSVHKSLTENFGCKRKLGNGSYPVAETTKATPKSIEYSAVLKV